MAEKPNRVGIALHDIQHVFPGGSSAAGIITERRPTDCHQTDRAAAQGEQANRHPAERAGPHGQPPDGKQAQGAAAAGMRAGEGSVQVPDRAAARALVAGVLRPGDVVLVKASRAYGLEQLAADLLDGATA